LKSQILIQSTPRFQVIEKPWIIGYIKTHFNIKKNQPLHH